MAKDWSKHLGRRDLLKGLGYGLGAAAVGCVAGRPDPYGVSRQALCGVGRAPTDWEAVRNRVEHVVILCMENRSFDHYYGPLSLPTSIYGGEAYEGVSGLTATDGVIDQVNYALDGTAYPAAFLDDTSMHDLPHHWEEMRTMFHADIYPEGNSADVIASGHRGNNDGFVRAAQWWARQKVDDLQGGVPEDMRLDADGLAELMSLEAMSYYTRRELGVMYWLAEQFAVCDNYYSSVLGPTWTNRFFLHGATARGLKNNLSPHSVASGLRDLFRLINGWESIMDVMERNNGLPATNFYHDACWLRLANADVGREIRTQFHGMNSRLDRFRPIGFFRKVEADRLPPLSIIDPHFGLFRPEQANDDHPDPGGTDAHDVRKGQALIGTVIAALAENPDVWNKTVLFITYDEAGGFYDHMPPPTVVDPRPEFEQLGFRVPTVMVSPFSRRGCAVSTLYDHVSVLRTIEHIFGQVPKPDGSGYEFLNRWREADVLTRVDNSNAMLDCFDADALETADDMLYRPGPDDIPDTEIALQHIRPRPGMVTQHPEMAAVLSSMPAEQQRHARDPDILNRVLAEGERLGVVETKA